MLKAISASFANYKSYGARSTQKLKPLHDFLASTLLNIWGTEYKVKYLAENNKELKVAGKYYDKNIDITITKNNKPIFCVGIKFITSNYKQNSNNYFENMMGETANIQANQLPYAHFIVLRRETPYYAKNTLVQEAKESVKTEIINQHDLQKYVNLMYDTVQSHRPFATAIILIDINEEDSSVQIVDAEQIFEKQFADLLTNKLSFNNFIFEINQYKNFFQSKL